MRFRSLFNYNLCKMSRQKTSPKENTRMKSKKKKKKEAKAKNGKLLSVVVIAVRLTLECCGWLCSRVNLITSHSRTVNAARIRYYCVRVCVCFSFLLAFLTHEWTVDISLWSFILRVHIFTEHEHEKKCENPIIQCINDSHSWNGSQQKPHEDTQIRATTRKRCFHVMKMMTTTSTMVGMTRTNQRAHSVNMKINSHSANSTHHTHTQRANTKKKRTAI